MKFYEARSMLWAEDATFVTQQLLALASSRDSRFFHAVDARRIGTFGHSLGGRSAVTACMLDHQIKACLNEDGRLDDVQFQRPFWPLPNHEFAGAFAMLDWFDPGLDDEDYTGMHISPADYAKARLTASGAALETYRTRMRGSFHITLLRRGMSHTAFADLAWLTAGSQVDRARYAGYLGSRVAQRIARYLSNAMVPR